MGWQVTLHASGKQVVNWQQQREDHGSKSHYWSSTRTVPRCISHDVSIVYRPIHKIR